MPKRIPRGPQPRVPKTAATTRVPVKRVAKLTDRVSTGLDLWDSASEATTTGDDHQNHAKILRRQQWVQQASAFTISLIKNSVLGAIVFETYCAVIAKSEEWITTRSNSSSRMIDKEQPQPSNFEKAYPQDMFETTPVVAHFVAGAMAGTVQGVGGIVWDAMAWTLYAARKGELLPWASSWAATKTMTTETWTPHLRSIGQHTLAQATLFGSYESLKRLFLWNMRDDDVLEEEKSDNNYNENTGSNNQRKQQPPLERSRAIFSSIPQQRLEYFTGVAIAGGLAGQCQHVMSHVMEQQQPFAASSRPTGWWWPWAALLPTARSTIWAFPPSAIAFLAFEYGKESIADLVDDED